MGHDDWYRGDAWSRRDQEAFETRLARARPGNREQYLRIKGLGLIESKRGARRKAGAELLERLLRDFPDQASEVAGAHEHLAGYYVQEGDPQRAAAHYRACLEVEAGRNFRHGAELSLAALIAAEQSLSADSDEALRLLAAAADDGLLFGSQQFRWALAHARLAARVGNADLAAAFALGALYLSEHDEPAAPRHPTVGLIGAIDRKTRRELKRLADGGDPERGAALYGSEIRRSDGEAAWDWPLVGGSVAEEREASAGASATEPDGRATKAEHARLVLAELQAAGIADVADLFLWAQQRRGSAAEVRASAPVLVRWLRDDATHPEVRMACAAGLADPRARKFAAEAVIDAFDELAAPADAEAPSGLKVCLGNALYKLARDEQLDRLEAIVRNPRHGRDRIYAFWALDYCKDPRVVDLLIDLVDDPEIGINALHCLKSARSERAEPVLQRLAAQPRLPRKYPELDADGPEFLDLERDYHRRDLEIWISKQGLKKLEQARAKGNARP